MRRGDAAPCRTLLVFFRHPGKDIVILVQVVADQPGAIIRIRVDVIIDIIFVEFHVSVIRVGFVTVIGSGLYFVFFSLFVGRLDRWHLCCLYAFGGRPATPAADHRLGVKLRLAPGTYDWCPVEIIITHATRQACTFQTEICLGHKNTHTLYAGTDMQFGKWPPY